MKSTLMIHEFQKEFIKLPLVDYVLTFDDGLYSQYAFYQEIKHIPTPKIFFISSGLICENTQSAEFPACNQAHRKAFTGNKEDYMTVEQITKLMADPWVTIGAHSHSHTSLSGSLVNIVKHIQADTQQMLEWFDTNLGFRPTSFCFPYNEDPSGIYKGLLKKYGFTDFYGDERIPIETLLHDGSQPDSRGTLKELA
jgi:peptidoglycan/xylan/chitin deacetylase (PgdA/CDA1 family)